MSAFFRPRGAIEFDNRCAFCTRPRMKWHNQESWLADTCASITSHPARARTGPIVATKTGITLSDRDPAPRHLFRQSRLHYDHRSLAGVSSAPTRSRPCNSRRCGFSLVSWVTFSARHIRLRSGSICQASINAAPPLACWSVLSG